MRGDGAAKCCCELRGGLGNKGQNEFIYILVLCPCDAQLNKKYFDNIIKLNNKQKEKKKKLSYMEDVYYVCSSLAFFFKNKYYKIF